MAKAAVVESTSASDFAFKRPELVVKMKRKTPSELREEQLKRKANQKPSEGDPSQTSKLPKYVNTRVSEVYPVKKSSDRCRLQYLKDRTKDSTNVDEKAKNAFSFSRTNEDESSKETMLKKTEQCSQSSLRNVIQLHLKDEISPPSTTINMEKAFKGFGVPSRASLSSDPSRNCADVDSLVPDTCLPNEILIPGNKYPLDLTLKTSLRLVSSASVQWCQRIKGAHYPFQSSGSQVGPKQSKEQVLSKALCSWIYPLPSSVVYASVSSNSKADKDFMLQRRQEWEDSFENLYNLLRKNFCNIFYVYTSEFVVLFIGANDSLVEKEKKKRSCNAYLSKSTRRLRSTLKKHGVKFSMPLSNKEEDEESDDDMEEILEIQRKNLGQAIFSNDFCEMDNTSESLLSINGNTNVHALYDFLLNNRFYLNSFNGGDVPSLYSPIPFENSSLNFAMVRCKEMRKADMTVPLDLENNNYKNGFDKMCYSIEISNSIIPPWVISGICHAMSIDGSTFDSTFTNDGSSLGFNVALKSSFSKESDGNNFGIENSIVVPSLHSCSVQKLRYANGSYLAVTTS